MASPGQQRRIERRLAAILAANIAGYSRLMGADEAGTGPLEFRGSGGNKSNAPEDEATRNGKAAAPQRGYASTPDERQKEDRTADP